MSNYAGNNNFTGIQAGTFNPSFNSVAANAIFASAIQTTSLNAVNDFKVGSTLIAQLPPSFYAAAFAAGSAANPILLVDLDTDYIALPVSTAAAPVFLTGLQFIAVGFGQATGGSFANPASAFLGTCSLAKANISFASVYNNIAPLVGGQIQLTGAAGVASVSLNYSLDTTSGSGGTQVAGQGLGATLVTNGTSVPGFSALQPLVANTVVAGNNYLCAYFTPLATAVASNAVGALYVYISYIGVPPTSVAPVNAIV